MCRIMHMFVFLHRCSLITDNRSRVFFVDKVVFVQKRKEDHATMHFLKMNSYELGLACWVNWPIASTIPSRSG